jgi:hypothetical protein
MGKIERKGTGAAGNAANAFTTIQPDAGTSPAAASSTDTLTLTSSDNSITITGNSATDTIDFIVASAAGESFKTISTPSGTSPVADSATDTLTLAGTDLTITGDSTTDTITFDASGLAKLAGRAGGQTLQGGNASGNHLILDSTSHATKGIVKVSGIMTVGSTTQTNTGTLGASLFGYSSVMSGESNLGSGYSLTVDGNYAFASGYINASRGTATVAFGRNSTAQGAYSFAMGRQLYTPPTDANGSHFLGDSDPDTLGEQTCPAADALVGRFKGGFELYRGAMTGVSYRLKQGTVNTTDATVTTVQTIATASNKSYMIEARVTARRTGGAGGAAGDSAAYIVRTMVKNVAGTLTLSGLATDFSSEDQAAWDATLTVSGTNILVRVTGAANNNITWNSTTVIDVV